jgi:hypothetical protein
VVGKRKKENKLANDFYATEVTEPTARRVRSGGLCGVLDVAEERLGVHVPGRPQPDGLVV